MGQGLGFGVDDGGFRRASHFQRSGCARHGKLRRNVGHGPNANLDLLRELLETLRLDCDLEQLRREVGDGILTSRPCRRRANQSGIHRRCRDFCSYDDRSRLVGNNTVDRA